MSDEGMKHGEEAIQHHIHYLRKNDWDELADFFRWFEDNSVIEDGVVQEVPLDKIEEQNYFNPETGLGLMNAFILGSCYEQKYPASPLDPDTSLEDFEDESDLHLWLADKKKEVEFDSFEEAEGARKLVEHIAFELGTHGRQILKEKLSDQEEEE